MNQIDLQIQSTISDGKHTPREIVEMARDFGIRVISLTDHDAVEGVEDAIAAGNEYGIRVIPGIEMSVEERGCHILGYGIDRVNQPLLGALQISRQQRIDGVHQMMENLKKNEGFVVDWDDVLNDTPGSLVITRPHLVRAIMKRSENVKKLEGVTKNDFFKRYLSEDGPNYIHRPYMSAKDVILLLHGAGGVVVWSHPAIHFKNNYEELEKFLQELISWGIDGLEVFNPSHTEDDSEFLQGLCGQYQLLYTAGSDFHEKGDHPSDSKTGLHSARTLGDFETYGFVLDDVVPKLDQAIEERRQEILPQKTIEAKPL